ncbi:MAG: TatD family hydrolase [Oscillospiraceae bacterium]|nr:TatD family hydrolase [Oscillospiraceae bacterium]
MNIFDTHAHYDDEAFDGDRDALLSELFSGGICGIINCGCDLKSSLNSLALTQKYPQIYAAVGVHPHEAEEVTEQDMQKLRALYAEKKVVAVGEIGLDYHYDFSPRDRQLEIFEKQLALSKELSLPVIIHDREAHEDTLRLLKQYRPTGVVHCFSGSVEMAQEIIALGMYIGLGGAVTFKNAKRPVAVAEYVPLDRLLLETDAPYMAPVPCRGQRCNSLMIDLTAQKIAEIKGLAKQELIDTCTANAKTLFSL